MATRRPASRARINTVSSSMPPPPPPMPRSRSVMSTKPGPAMRSTEDTIPDMPGTHSNPRLHRSTTNQEDAETNIRVVIRCRRRSEREIQDSSPIIVSSSGAKSKDVSIEASAPVSSLGVITLPPVRTYPFDLVFGPEADQAMIYHDVVSPMLDEVLQGYNCTLFAYGQTGTGKTYTMQGDLTPTPMGNPSANAGMIPRVLFRLFHHLETSGTDYSVKISFIELYNEELRDLLATELSAPMGSTQPMGLTSKDTSKAPDGGLKIFDDASKRGVFIQGLEEISVKDSKDALALLTKGSHRRQIAATKFNDHSSRSHSVFSVTVHIKETSTMGDDLLKIGKLNLVDLAGSENIGRSGAENKRAREAGMINQSLLTLGRVINALVDKAQHVPYRESKLTRLLQDSLGGRTKTCIVATISPARSNMEETLSTLDYAMRAKSIRNKPELNQRMTRNSLLKEYVGEIERLKADLLAAREKNGIFFSEETWNQLNAEQELRQTEMEEAKKQVEIVESQMRSVREEFEQSIALLTRRDEELRETRDRLKETEASLEQREGELKVVKVALEEEVVVRKAHQETEATLDVVAGELKQVAHETLRDVGGLFEKLERKSAILNSNSRAVLTQKKVISTATNALSQKLDDFIKSSSQATIKLLTESRQFETKELEALASKSDRINVQLQRVQELLTNIQAKDTLEAEALAVVQTTLKELHGTFKVDFDTWGGTLKATCERLCKEVETAGLGGFSAVEKALKEMASLVETIVRETRAHTEAEHKSLLEAKALAATMANTEIARLRQQNQLLVRVLENEKIKADKAKDELIQRVSGLLGDFTKERDRGLREAIGVFRTGNEEAEEGMQVFGETHDGLMNAMNGRALEAGSSMLKRGGDGKRLRDGAFKTLNHAKATFDSEMPKLQATLAGSIESYSVRVQEKTQAMAASSNGAFERHSRAKRARTEATSLLGNDVQSEYRHIHRSFASTSRNVEAIAGRVTSEMSALSAATEGYNAASSSHLASVQQATQALAEQGARDDLPTGSTPRKRIWEYVDQWELTRGRTEVLAAWKQRSTSSVGHDTFVAEHRPLPEGDEDLDEHTEMGIQLSRSPSAEPEPELVTPLDSPVSVSLASSVSSSSSTSIPIPHARHPQVPPPRKAAGKTVLPASSTLSDMKNVYTTRRSRRAR